MRFSAGDRVTWEDPYGDHYRGTVADVPPWKPVDRLIAPGARIPVDLDRPPAGGASRYYVREDLLEYLPASP